MNRTINIGTRGSKLALYQAYRVKESLETHFPDYRFEIIIVKTKGDKILDVPLSKIGDKGLFTKELEVQLLNKEIDMAVHSLKDLPTVFPPGTCLGGVLPRGSVNDALVSVNGKTIDQLDETDVIATSSLRRKAQLLKINPKLKTVEIRGNINTRIRKMQEGNCTAMIMAATGLQRLEMDKHISEIIDLDTMIPACSQGAIGIEIRENDSEIGSLLEAINDKKTSIATEAERAFLRTLEGGCQIPVGSYTLIVGNLFKIKGFISSIDGSIFLEDQAESTIKNATETAIQLANKLSEKGGKAILDAIRSQNIKNLNLDSSLQNQTFVCTATPASNKRLTDLLLQKGARSISLPMIEIQTAQLQTEEKNTLSEIESFDWLFFTSKNGVIYFFKQLLDIQGNTHLPKGINIACIGKQTASELDYYGYKAEFISSGNNAEDMLRTFNEQYHQDNQKILLALGSLAPHFLESELGKEHQIKRINIYHTINTKNIDNQVIKNIKSKPNTNIILTSPSAFNHFKTYFLELELKKMTFACIGTTTKKTLEKQGLKPSIIAHKSNIEGLIEAIEQYYKQKHH